MIKTLQASTTETVELTSREKVQQGQIVMFVELSYRYLDEDTSTQIASLMGAPENQYQGSDEDETIFDRVTSLARGFVDGVLSVFEVKTGTFEVNQVLCIDGVCIDEGELQTLIDSLGSESEGQNEESDVVPPISLEEEVSSSTIGVNEEDDPTNPVVNESVTDISELADEEESEVEDEKEITETLPESETE